MLDHGQNRTDQLGHDLEIVGPKAGSITAAQGDDVGDVVNLFQKPGNCSRRHSEKGQSGVRLISPYPAQGPERCGEDECDLFQRIRAILSAAQCIYTVNGQAVAASFSFWMIIEAGGQYRYIMIEGSKTARNIGAGISRSSTNWRILAVDDQNLHAALRTFRSGARNEDLDA